MLTQAQCFLREITCEKFEPRWLSFLGKSGNGKTFLSECILQSLPQKMHEHPSLIDGVHKLNWNTLINRARQGDFAKINTAIDANFLLLDDFGVGRETEFSVEKLYEILEQRTRKWTLLTSNLMLSEINAKDTRAASRLIRGQNVVVEVDTVDFALRPPGSKP